MRTLNFAKRNIKELIREPLSLVFCIVLPLFFLIIFQQFNIPSESYSIENFTPSIVVFSYSFISLFVAELIAKDRSCSLLTRLFASPMRPWEYILGYTIAFIPLTIAQSIIFFAAGVLLGMEFKLSIIITILILIFISILFISLGILIGCLTTEKSAGPCGSLIVQLVSFTSGMWFPIDAAGNFFKIVCRILPFEKGVALTKYFLNGTKTNVLIDVIVIIAFTVVTYTITVILFKKKMTNDNK